jgi:hypothetical protein
MDCLILFIVFIIFGLLVNSELAKLRGAPLLCQAFVFKLGWGRPFWDEVLGLLPRELAYLEAQGRAGGQFLCVTIERWRSHTTIEVHEVQDGASPRTRWIRVYGKLWERMDGWFDSPPGSIWSLQLDEADRRPSDWPMLEVRLLLPILPFRHADVGRIQLYATGGRFGWLSDPSISWPGRSSEPRPENIFLDVPLDKSGSHEDSERGFQWSLSLHDFERVGHDLLSITSSADSAHSAPRPNAFIRVMRFFGHYIGRILGRARAGQR